MYTTGQVFTRSTLTEKQGKALFPASPVCFGIVVARRPYRLVWNGTGKTSIVVRFTRKAKFIFVSILIVLFSCKRSCNVMWGFVDIEAPQVFLFSFSAELSEQN